MPIQLDLCAPTPNVDDAVFDEATAPVREPRGWSTTYRRLTRPWVRVEPCRVCGSRVVALGTYRYDDGGEWLAIVRCTGCGRCTATDAARVGG